MSVNFGLEKPNKQLLPRVRDRISFLYLEHCKINRQDGAISCQDEKGTVLVPAATISVLLLGPGTSIAHRAVELISAVGASIVWIGEEGVRYYANGEGLTTSSNLIMKQAKLISNERSRLSVARNMYQMRFPNEIVEGLTMQQLRGREGSRIRKTYKEWSRITGVPWDKRTYDPENYGIGNPINQALSAGHACLYGLCHSVIVALGCSPSLGFIHTGHARAFVYDIADIYKAEVTIPIAFQVAAEEPDDIGAEVRHRCRDYFHNSKLIEKIVKDLKILLDEEECEFEVETSYLWDKDHLLKHGVSYSLSGEDK
jgi:CRISPR-associated protein Cas1